MPGNLSTVKALRCKSKYLWSNVLLLFFVGFLAEGRGCRSDSWDTYPSIQHCPSVLWWIQVRETIKLDWLESSYTVKRPKRALMRSWRSLEFDLFRLSGFESYYKFTRKKLTCAVLIVASNITHSPIGQLSLRHRWISHQTGMKSPFKWHNQPGKINDFCKSTIQ